GPRRRSRTASLSASSPVASADQGTARIHPDAGYLGSAEEVFVSPPQDVAFDDRQAARLGNRDELAALFFRRRERRIDAGAGGEQHSLIAGRGIEPDAEFGHRFEGTLAQLE